MTCPSKTCKRCGETKPLTEFYKHPNMRDGHLNFCKACSLKTIHAYQKGHGRETHLENCRVQTAKQTSSEKTARAYLWATKYPERKAAHKLVEDAIREGTLVKLPCLVCGKEAVAHHPDYSRPLDVVWLCQAHHMEAHALINNQTLVA